MQIGMGWMGWTEQQTLDTTMPAIETAYKGRLDMLQAIFGGKSDPVPEPAPAEPKTMSGEQILNIFRSMKKPTNH